MIILRPYLKVGWVQQESQERYNFHLGWYWIGLDAVIVVVVAAVAACIEKIHNYLAGRESARQTADFNTYLLLLLYYKIIIESNWCIGGNWEGINFFLEEKYYYT